VRVNHANHNRDDDGHHDGDYNGHDVLANGHADGEPVRIAISVANVYTDCFAVRGANRGSICSPECDANKRSNCDPNSITQCITQRNPNDISHRSTVSFTKRCAVCDPNRFTQCSTECCSVCVTHWRAQHIADEFAYIYADCSTECNPNSSAIGRPYGFTNCLANACAKLNWSACGGNDNLQRQLHRALTSCTGIVSISSCFCNVRCVHGCEQHAHRVLPGGEVSGRSDRGGCECWSRDVGHDDL
jgi:hypothetical protein